MRHIVHLFLFTACLGLVSCQSSFQESWDNTLAAITRKKESDREFLNGRAPSPTPTSPASARTAATPADASGRIKPVRLKPFLVAPSESSPSSTPAKPASTPGSKETPGPSSSPQPKPKPTPKPSAVPSSDPKPTAARPTPEPVAGEEVPFANRVPGKKGFVTSPYVPDSGLIDVTGLPPGSEARDPYSGKVFRVP